MPEEGVAHVPRKELLTFEEIDRLVGILRKQGIKHVRLTGGEPLVRKGIDELISMLGRHNDLELSMTTNGVLLQRHLGTISENRMRLNVSLDSLDREVYARKTRRDELPSVLKSLQAALECNIPIRLNAVIANSQEQQHVIELAELAKRHRLQVRFIEKMKFDGSTSRQDVHAGMASGSEIRQWLRVAWPELQAKPRQAGATAEMLHAKSWQGSVGVINSRSRTFCSDCNRIRISATGQLRLCLYSRHDTDIRSWLRDNDVSDSEIAHRLARAVLDKPENGFVAESAAASSFVPESMISIGG